MLTASELNNFTGTEGYTRWSPLFPSLVLTDGSLFVAEHGGQCGAYWLFDAIASHQPDVQRHPDERLKDMQFWTLKVNADKTAVLTCVADSGEEPVVTQRIEFTDFDLPEIDLWVSPTDDGKGGVLYVILLPSEY
jgi:hypothetical protein